MENTRYEDVILDNILVLSTKDSDVTSFESFVESRKLHKVNDLDELLTKFENLSGGITICFTDHLPDDIEENLGTLVGFLEEDNTNSKFSIVEIGGKGNFKESLKVRSVFELSELLVIENVDDVEESVETEVDGIESSNTVSNMTDVKYMELLDKFETLKVEARNRIVELDNELITYKKTYAERVEEVVSLNELVEQLKGELADKDNLINNDLSNKEIELNKLLKEANEELRLKSNEITKLKSLISSLQEDILKAREEVESIRIDYAAQRELLKEKKIQIEELKETLYKEERFKKELLEELNVVKTDYISPMEYEKVEQLVEDKSDEIDGLKVQLNELRILAKKADTERSMVESDLDDLKNSYKELLSNSGSSSRKLDEIVFDELNSKIIYFKVINQPLYFRSFVEEFNKILSGMYNKVLFVILREDSELTSMYYKGIRKVTTLDDVSSSDRVVWLKPSQLMFPKDVEFYNGFDVIVVLDYLDTRKRYLRGDNVTTIHTFLSDSEAELFGITGTILSAGDRSMIDMKYDVKFSNAPNTELRRLMVQRKIKDWLKVSGIL